MERTKGWAPLLRIRRRLAWEKPRPKPTLDQLTNEFDAWAWNRVVPVAAVIQRWMKPHRAHVSAELLYDRFMCERGWAAWTSHFDTEEMRRLVMARTCNLYAEYGVLAAHEDRHGHERAWFVRGCAWWERTHKKHWSMVKPHSIERFYCCEPHTPANVVVITHQAGAIEGVEA